MEALNGPPLGYDAGGKADCSAKSKASQAPIKTEIAAVMALSGTPSLICVEIPSRKAS